ncbi:hypothetical protein [Streptomyces sp. NBC_00316]|uniref:hypothetical protein n=1 Tax=Streptomyces sp. NBC_00316 TaxID=2975710 RepID=UPI002E2A8831|nr:hypothetical protein [Streptomyces sp. NBC_00316]
MRPHRRVTHRASAVLVAAVGAASLAGCGTDGGQLRSAGPAPTVIGPARLWPQLPPASAAPYDYGEGATARIPGITVPHDDVHTLDPVAVVQADLMATTSRSSGSDELPADTVRRITACRTAPTACPVLQPYYRDLTGNGRDDMVLGVRRNDGRLSVRVYMANSDALTRIMAVSDAVISVELAGRDVIMRVPSAIAGYEYRTVWSWDGRQHAMLPTQDEILRKTAETAPSARPSAEPSPRPATTSPSPGVSEGRR